MDVNDFMRKMFDAYPDAAVEQDSDGQLVIYTNLTIRDGKVVSMDD